MEEWKDIEGYEGLYQVSNLGRVKSLEKDYILKPAVDRYGYYQLHLFKDKRIKNIRIHRLVAKAFIPNPDNLPQINHKDENKLNNCIDNLEWCTQRYNNEYGTRTERTSKKVLCIETGQIFNSIKSAGRWVGKDYAHRDIRKAANDTTKTAYKYHWQFIEKG